MDTVVDKSEEIKTVSILVLYCSTLGTTKHLETSIKSWRWQDYPIKEILLCDTSKPRDRDKVKEVCKKYDVQYYEYPFNNFKARAAHIYNDIFPKITGDLVIFFCANWELLQPDWIRIMVQRSIVYGPNCILMTDNDKQATAMTLGGIPVDWGAGREVIYKVADSYWIDNPKCIFHREAWIPMDTDFDADEGGISNKHNAHGIIYWAWEQQHKYGRDLMVVRDMKMRHAPSNIYPMEGSEDHDYANVRSDAIFKKKTGEWP
jgi:hypothetical protein